jgi:transposase
MNIWQHIALKRQPVGLYLSALNHVQLPTAGSSGNVVSPWPKTTTSTPHGGICRPRSYSVRTQPGIREGRIYRWPKDELKELKRLYASGATVQEIQKTFPERSLPGLRYAIYHHLKPVKPFPEHEMQIVRDMRAQGKTLADIRNILPHRSNNAINLRVKRGIAQSDSTIVNQNPYISYSNAEEDDVKLLHAEGKSILEIAKAMDRSYSSIRLKMAQLGLQPHARASHSIKHWTEEELSILKPVIGKRLTDADLAALLPHRTSRQIHSRIARLRLEAGIYISAPQFKWSEKECQTLKRMMSKGVALARISELMNRSYGSVYQRARRLVMDRMMENDLTGENSSR